MSAKGTEYNLLAFLESINKKDQKITLCDVGAHHHNGIIENKNKMLTISGRTLLLHAISHWPEMIDSMFWPFAMKAAVEHHNSLLVNTKNQNPSSVLYTVALGAIPVKKFYTMFYPVQRPRPAKVAATMLYWCLPRALPISRQKCGARVQSNHRPSVATVSCCIWRLLLNIPLHECRNHSPKQGWYCHAFFRAIYVQSIWTCWNWSSNIPPLVLESDRVPDPALDRITDPFAYCFWSDICFWNLNSCTTDPNPSSDQNRRGG